MATVAERINKMVGDAPEDFWQMYTTLEGCQEAAEKMTQMVVDEVEKVGRVYTVFAVEDAAQATADAIRRAQSEFSSFGAADSEGRMGLYAVLQEFFGQDLAEKYFW